MAGLSMVGGVRSSNSNKWIGMRASANLPHRELSCTSHSTTAIAITIAIAIAIVNCSKGSIATRDIILRIIQVVFAHLTTSRSTCLRLNPNSRKSVTHNQQLPALSSRLPSPCRARRRTTLRRIADLSLQYLDRRLFVQLNGSRKVIGVLRGYDVLTHHTITLDMSFF